MTEGKECKNIEQIRLRGIWTRSHKKINIRMQGKRRQRKQEVKQRNYEVNLKGGKNELRREVCKALESGNQVVKNVKQVKNK